MPIAPAAPLTVSDEDRAALERMARSDSLPHRTVRQANALLLAADGVANEEIARRSEADADTVRAWRRRFEEKGPAGIGVIAKGRGRRPLLPEGTVPEVVRVTQCCPKLPSRTAATPSSGTVRADGVAAGAEVVGARP